MSQSNGSTGEMDSQNVSEIKQEIDLNSSREGDEQASTYNKNRRRRYKNKKEKNGQGRTWTKLEDPNAPRKPRSAYVHFLSSQRAKYGTVKQGCDQKSINVALAAEWQALTAEGRKVFTDIALKERSEYQDAMIKYQQTEDYAKFMQKKDIILRQRKQCRKLGVDSDSYIENMMTNMSPKGSKKKNLSMTSMDSTFVPTLPNSEIPIFSKEFLDYNKEREAQLRQIRRNIGIAENEQESMKTTSERLQHSCETFRQQISEDEKMIDDANVLMNSWIQTAVTTLMKSCLASQVPDLSQMSHPDLIDFLCGIAHPTNNQQQNLNASFKTALHGVNFNTK